MSEQSFREWYEEHKSEITEAALDHVVNEHRGNCPEHEELRRVLEENTTRRRQRTRGRLA